MLRLASASLPLRSCRPLGLHWQQIMRKITLDTKPPVQRGMEILDRHFFRKDLPIVAGRVPASKAGSILRAPEAKRSILDLPKFKTVIPDPSHPEGRLVLFGVSDQADLSAETRTYLTSQDVELIPYTISLDYDYWIAEDILQAILPESLLDGAPAGFAVTGHLAHMNLNDEYLPYKHLIGQVILDKNKGLRTVVNKLNSIDTKFRFFQMELLAGEPDYIVEHHESNCSFTFDFTKVYWNSRLHHEHERLVAIFEPQDVVADVFAGVGPFALPAAKKGCAVWANDLNPESFKYLTINTESNKVTDNVRPSCEDGREFIRAIARRAFDNPVEAWAGPKPTRSQQRAHRKARDNGQVAEAGTDESKTEALPPRKIINHFVMNLPDSALTFLDAYRGCLADPDLKEAYVDRLPTVHCHCFTRELDPKEAEKDIVKRAEDSLGHTIGNDYTLHLVRSVAPNKDMYCISFKLPAAVAFA